MSNHPLWRFRPILSWGILVEIIFASVVYGLCRVSFDYATLSEFVGKTVDLWTALVGVLFGGALAVWGAFAATTAGPFGEYLDDEGKLRAFSTCFLFAAATFYLSTILLIVAKGVENGHVRHAAIWAVLYSLTNGVTMLTNSAHVLVLYSTFQKEFRSAMKDFDVADKLP